MKNSTDKPVKKQGPIRFEAIVPLAIVVGLIVAYFSLFFDSHLRRGLEYAATQGNGAEVDIATVKTSVFKASVLIAGVQMTDPAQPMQNRVEIGQIRFRMLWDALLRGKVMIDEAVIEDVQVATARQRAGYVLPPEPEQAEGPSATDKMLEQMKQEFSGNVVGDLAAIAAGADPSGQLKVAGSDLKSGAFLDELKKSQDEMEQQWRERIAALPRSEDFNALRTRLSKVQTKDFKDVMQVQASVKELQAIRDEFDALSKPVGEAGGKLGGDMGTLRTSFTDLEKVMREDVQGLQARLKLPSLDAATLSRALFGMDVLGKLQQGKGYMEQARQYMPAKGAKKVAPKQIHKGHDYAFGRPKAYPAFWLRRAAVTSTLPGGKGLSGEILDVATDQALTGKPMQALLKGNFPQQGINGVKAELLVDHRKEVPLERLSFEVGSYALAGRTLVDSDSVKLAFSKADVASGVSGELRGDKVDLRMSSRFGAAAFETSAKTTVVREMMAASLSGLDAVTMDARVSGTWSDLDWKLSSNLGDAMVKGMGRYLQAKMDEAKKRIQAMVDAQIGEQRQRLQARQKEIESQLKDALAKPQAQVDKLRAELDAARKDLDKRKNAVVDSQKKKLKQDAGKLLDKWR
ncbi:MAG: TIGR03545 family protein [Gammaproteobacteria bacterium]|nr:TIGR03545 family protein [Gammaproteobacteria bacterium]MBU1967690.1 TIGR03545 family protein [Gammaproteobacteria bacterium]